MHVGALLSILTRTDSHGFSLREVHARVALAVFGLTLSDSYDFQLPNSYGINMARPLMN